MSKNKETIATELCNILDEVGSCSCWSDCIDPKTKDAVINICKNVIIDWSATKSTRKDVRLLFAYKQFREPTKPLPCTDNGTGTRCPRCTETLLTNWKPKFCMNCGQRIDWSDYDEC